MKLEPCPNPWCESEVSPFLRKGSLTREAPVQVQIECGCGIYGPACDTEAEAIAAWNRRTPPASQSDEALVIPGQIPPFLSAPTFDDRAEQRVCINGCLYLRADFAGERQASARAEGRRAGIEEAAQHCRAWLGHKLTPEDIAAIRALAEKQP